MTAEKCSPAVLCRLGACWQARRRFLNRFGYKRVAWSTVAQAWGTPWRDDARWVARQLTLRLSQQDCDLLRAHVGSDWPWDFIATKIPQVRVAEALRQIGARVTL